MPTQQRQSVVEPSPSLVETLVRDGEPLELLGQKLATALSQQALVHLVQLPGVIVDGPDLVVGILCKVELHGCLHPNGRLAPSRDWLLCSGGGRLERFRGCGRRVGGVGAKAGHEGAGGLSAPREAGAAGLEGHGGGGNWGEASSDLRWIEACHA